MNRQEIGDDIHKPSEGEKVLVGIPAYNEEVGLGSVLWKLNKLDMNHDVLVVDDGSDDETSEIARDSGAKVLKHETNLGKGSAIQTIFTYMSRNDYDYVVLMDGDGQHNPYEVPKVLSSIVNPGADMVIGTRWGDWTEMPFYRRIGKFVLDKMTPGGNGRDTQSGFRALSAGAVEEMDLKETDFTIESEMVAEAEEKGLDIKNERITCKYDDVNDPSTEGPVAHGMSVLGKIIRLTVERRPLMYLGVPGLIFFLAGLISGGYVVHTAAQDEILSMGFGLITIVFIIMGSIFVTSGFILNEISRLMKKEAEHEKKHLDVFEE